jgi:hypothetical protein
MIDPTPNYADTELVSQNFLYFLAIEQEQDGIRIQMWGILGRD